MTIAQQLEQKGLEQGIKPGEQRGIDRSIVMKTGLSEHELAQSHH